MPYPVARIQRQARRRRDGRSEAEGVSAGGCGAGSTSRLAWSRHSSRFRRRSSNRSELTRTLKIIKPIVIPAIFADLHAAMVCAVPDIIGAKIATRAIIRKIVTP